MVVLGGKELSSLSKTTCELPSYGSAMVPEPGLPEVEAIQYSNWSGSSKNESSRDSFTVNGSKTNASSNDMTESFLFDRLYGAAVGRDAPLSPPRACGRPGPL